jgi:formate hydrogenlyase subunit 3/multisubunit Na+/H+ antiporter MnhD subunit
MSDHPTRRDLMKPVQLLGLAFLAAAFSFFVTLISMGFFQQRFRQQSVHALQVAGIVGGITFIATLLIIALLILAVDPAQVAKQIDRPVLLTPEDMTAQDAATQANAAQADTAQANTAQGNTAPGDAALGTPAPKPAASDEPRTS